MQKTILIGVAAFAFLGGCNDAPKESVTDAPATPEVATGTPVPEAVEPKAVLKTPVDDPTHGSHRFASWAGKWTGVEGMYVTITPAEPGKYQLEMQSDLDTKGTYQGSDSEHGIRFTRGTEALSLHRGNGDDTGLKYLAGKKECLIVKDGEGYCRD